MYTKVKACNLIHNYNLFVFFVIFVKSWQIMEFQIREVQPVWDSLIFFHFYNI
jgi:hypothetical protein